MSDEQDLGLVANGKDPASGEPGPRMPATPGYEITRFEVRAFMAALGLDPKEVDSLHVHGNRVVASLTTGEVIAVRIKESRG